MSPSVDAEAKQPTTQSKKWLSGRVGVGDHSTTRFVPDSTLFAVSALRCSENMRCAPLDVPQRLRLPGSPGVRLNDS